MSLLAGVSRALAFPIGLSFVYISLFFTKGDDGRLQNWLVDLWVKVEISSTARGAQAVTFFNEVAALLNRVLDRLFGLRLLSLQFVLTSATLSFSSLYFLLGAANRRALKWTSMVCGPLSLVE